VPVIPEAEEKQIAKPLYKNIIMFSDKQLGIMGNGRVVRLHRKGHYQDYAKKGYKPPISKTEIRRKIKELERML